MADDGKFIQRVAVAVVGSIIGISPAGKKNEAGKYTKMSYDVKLQSGPVMSIEFCDQIEYQEGDVVEFKINVPKSCFSAGSKLFKK